MIGNVQFATSFSLIAVQAIKEYADTNYLDSNGAVTDWGYSAFTPPSNTINLSDGDDIQTAVNNLPNGGTINLAAGTYTSGMIEIKTSDLVIKGASKTLTKLVYSGIDDRPFIRYTSLGIPTISNFVLSDIEIDAYDVELANGIEFVHGVENVLLENIHIYGADKSNIISYGTNWTNEMNKFFTFKNIVSHDNGIDNDTQFGHPLATRYTVGIIFEDIECYNSRNGIGIDFSHSRYVEMYNVNLHDMSQGIKMPGSTYWYIHDISISNISPAINHSGGDIAIRLDVSDEASEYGQMENISIDGVKYGIRDWGSANPAPTFSELSSDNITLTNVEVDTVTVRGATKLYEYGNTVDMFTEAATGSGDTTLYRQNTTTSPEADGVGWTTWGSPS